MARSSADSDSLASKLPPSRIAVIAFALVAAIIVIYELRVRGQYNASFNAVADRLEGETEPLYLNDINELISGSPERLMAEGNKNELFTWNGVMQTYRMRIHYGDGEFVQRVDPE